MRLLSRPSLILATSWSPDGACKAHPKDFQRLQPRGPLPGRRPAGLGQYRPHEVERRSLHQHRFPPYQYKDKNCVVRKTSKEMRIASLLEREVIMGMPAGYTQPCLAKSCRSEPQYSDTRLSLIGNAWCAPVVAWLIGCLTQVFGLSEPLSPQQFPSLPRSFVLELAATF